MSDRLEERFFLLAGRWLGHYPAALLWPVLLGSLGWFWGFVIAGHPHAWQVIPILGVALGIVLTIAHATFLFFFRRRAAQQGCSRPFCLRFATAKRRLSLSAGHQQTTREVLYERFVAVRHGPVLRCRSCRR